MMDGVDATSASEGSYSARFGMRYQSHIHRIDVFVTLMALSGMFSSTFTLTFAYISDVVKDRDGRVAAYRHATSHGHCFTAFESSREDRNASTRRAIVRAAAEIGRAMP